MASKSLAGPTSLLTDAKRTAFTPTESPPARVNWQEWASLPSVELWQGIALSCGIPPTTYMDASAVDRDFDRRMKVAIAHLIPGGLLTIIEAGLDNRKHLTRVSLRDIARLAGACSWSIPAMFPGPSPHQNAPEGDLFKTLPASLRGHHETVVRVYKELFVSLKRIPTIFEVWKSLPGQFPFANTINTQGKLPWSPGTGKNAVFTERALGEWLTKYANRSK